MDERLARRGLAGAAASHGAHAVVSPGAHHRHVQAFDQSGQSRWSVPHRLPPPGPWGLWKKKRRV